MSLIKCRAIVIRTIPFSESSVILKCLTDSLGIQSYLLNSVRSKKGSIRNSQLQPLTLLEIEGYHQENKNLQRIKELKCSPPLHHVHYDMIKSSVVLFISELLHKTVKDESHQDEPLFEFIFHSIQILDITNGNIANFPIYFMIQLSRYLGFYPKGQFSSKSNSFDLREGSFESYDELNAFHIDPFLSEKLSALIVSDFSNLVHIALNIKQRTKLLDYIIFYYSAHVSGFTELYSNKVLSEIFA